MLEPGVPESFKILVNELQSLGLKVTVEDESEREIDLRDKEEDYDDGRGVMRMGAAAGQGSAPNILSKRGFSPAGTYSRPSAAEQVANSFPLDER